jgi:imidazole glycerol-phosphate synthase subunit HisH
LLFDSSEEGEGAGLSVFRGRVRKLRARRIPHMGWNDVQITADDPMLNDLSPMLGYYANSFVADAVEESNVLAWTEYDEDRFPAVVRRDRTWGVQFHPEKSGEPGLQLIRNFLQAARA